MLAALSSSSRSLVRLRWVGVACCAVLGGGWSSALADGQADPLLAPAGLSDNAFAAEGASPQIAFGKAKTWWWNATVGVASDFDDIDDANVSIGFSSFAAEDVEVGGDLLLRYVVQDGNDALALNPQVVFRWHFWKGATLFGSSAEGGNTWTTFLEVGIGVMVSTDDVPPAATSINFTPRAGAGVTYAINDTTRLLASLRWSHVSNADIFGNDDNVGSDGVMLTLGCIWAW